MEKLATYESGGHETATDQYFNEKREGEKCEGNPRRRNRNLFMILLTVQT